MVLTKLSKNEDHNKNISVVIRDEFDLEELQDESAFEENFNKDEIMNINTVLGAMDPDRYRGKIPDYDA